ncbi:YafY family transcriptional regulator [Undibacterium jejuense]|uniref:YafY family transcriptional regulator n=1 Tax=Undibacterium jejuense TaxID=1344949 RepID=A0A923HKW0_9BURK|nr:YafY family protein [Undibacterium jejuense]MBC3861516.1 YafY family transcriptional regulator [Undibacterium jejuense]
MSRSERLLQLMQMLRRYRYPVTAVTLSQELGISVRSVYRDIASLQAQGAKIAGEAGIGYVLQDGFTLPPLMFSAEEIEAIVLGSRWVVERGDEKLAEAARDALAKIAAVLPVAEKRELETAGLLVGPRFDNQGNDALLRDIRFAIRNEYKLTLDYQDENGTLSKRVVWPCALAFFEQVRMVVAWCELRQDFRHFRTDRIQSLHSAKERFPQSRASLLKTWRQQQGIRQN